MFIESHSAEKMDLRLPRKTNAEVTQAIAHGMRILADDDGADGVGVEQKCQLGTKGGFGSNGYLMLVKTGGSYLPSFCNCQLEGTSILSQPETSCSR